MEEKVTVELKDKSWAEIEKSCAALLRYDPEAALSHDIYPHIEVIVGPSEIRCLIAEYASVHGPLSEARMAHVHLRLYALYKAGNLRAMREAIRCLQFGACSIKTYSFWIDRLGLELYYARNYEVATEMWICAHRSSTVEPLSCAINSALAVALGGDFVSALSLINKFHLAAKELEQPSLKELKDWKLFIKGMALAGLQMYDESLKELTKCILSSTMTYLTAQAVELKSAIETRTPCIIKTSKESDSYRWILDAHEKAAISHPYVPPPVVLRDVTVITFPAMIPLFF